MNSAKNTHLLSFISILLFFLVLGIPAKSQKNQLPSEVEIQIENYKVNAIKNRNAGNDNAAATYLNKVAFLYWEYFINAEAVKYFEEVLTINQNLQNKHGEQKVSENIAFVYSDMGRFDKSIEYFSKSLLLVTDIGNKLEIANCISNLALAYNSNGQYIDAINFAEKGLEISKELNDLKLLRSFYGILHESYDKKGDVEKAVEYFGMYSTIDKHIQQQLFKERENKSQRDLSEMSAQKDVAIQAKVQTEQELVKTQDTLKQSQLEVDLLNAENEVKEAKIQEREAKLKAERRLRYTIMIVFVFVCALTLLIYRQMQEKKRANAKLRELYEEIEKKNRQILDSINYASHIQEAILPYEKNMFEDLPNSFVFYKPRDIVSGDFYWHSRHDNLVFIAAIDCTGHGVPGAFMSMIGNTLLNEIVNEKEIFEPAQVLQLLNEKVEFTLNQNNNDQKGFNEDGMDITFCCFDKSTNMLQIALANHSAIIIKDGKLRSIEGDLHSIGGNIGIGISNYTNHSIKIDSDTTLYMFSDGYQDQFGGMKNQKYMTPRFIDFLEKIQEKPFSEHKKLIENE